MTQLKELSADLKLTKWLSQWLFDTLVDLSVGFYSAKKNKNQNNIYVNIMITLLELFTLTMSGSAKVSKHDIKKTWQIFTAFFDT